MKNLTRLLFIAIFSVIATGACFSQDSGSGESSKAKTRGEDPNIQMNEMINDSDKAKTDSRVIQPSDKGGKSRGLSYCNACFDNYTGWRINVYVDGFLEGGVGPWGDGCVTVSSGSTRLYAVAEFSDGSRVWWGPITKSCENQTFSMDMYETKYEWSVK